MASNVKYDRNSNVRLKLAVGASQSKGSVILLNQMPVFLLENSDSANQASGVLPGVGLVVELPVTGADNAGNVAVAVGHKIYKDGVQYNRDATNGVLIGYALGAVTSGATTAIQVALIAS